MFDTLSAAPSPPPSQFTVCTSRFARLRLLTPRNLSSSFHPLPPSRGVEIHCKIPLLHIEKGEPPPTPTLSALLKQWPVLISLCRNVFPRFLLRTIWRRIFQGFSWRIFDWQIFLTKNEDKTSGEKNTSGGSKINCLGVCLFVRV